MGLKYHLACKFSAVELGDVFDEQVAVILVLGALHSPRIRGDSARPKGTRSEKSFHQEALIRGQMRKGDNKIPTFLPKSLIHQMFTFRIKNYLK